MKIMVSVFAETVEKVFLQADFLSFQEHLF